jgi:hypothetical protein
VPSERAREYFRMVEAEAYRHSGAHRWTLDELRNFEQSFHDEHPDEFPPDHLEALRMFTDGIDPPTLYQNPTMIAMLESMYTDIEDAAETLMGDGAPSRENRPLIATLPTGEVNARAMLVPETDGEHIVVFDDQLFTFALLVSKVAARCFPPTAGGFEHSGDPWRDVLEEHPEIEERFVELVAAWLVTGRPDQAPQYWLSEPWRSLGTLLLEGMELFVLGHEFAHIALGHVDASLAKANRYGRAEASTIPRSWREELEADALGVDIAVAIHNREQLTSTFATAGAQIFFFSTHMLSEGLALLGTGTIPSNLDEESSHPPGGLRWAMMYEQVTARTGEKSESLEFADTLSRLLKTLWERAKPTILEWFEQGVRPAEAWYRPGF